MTDTPYPALKNDLQALEPYKEERKTLSQRATAAKKKFYRSQWITIIGGVVLMGFGAAQSGLPTEGTVSIAFAIAQALIGVIVGSTVLRTEGKKVQREWLGTRSASEELKHQFYCFLGRIGEYGDTDKPLDELDARVSRIGIQLHKYLKLGIAEETPGGNEA